MQDGPESAPCQIVCEGNADRVFLTRLIASRTISDCAVRCTHESAPNHQRCAGRDSLTKTLLALDAIRNLNPEAVKGIAIVFDSDEDPAASFKSAQESIRSAKLFYPIPDRPLEIKPSTSKHPTIAIALIPWHDRQGHLDELIFEALSTIYTDLLRPIDQYYADTKHRTGAWSFGSKSNFRLRCMLAASHQEDPSISLAYWLESSKCPIDYKDACFDKLAGFIEAFRKSVIANRVEPFNHASFGKNVLRHYIDEIRWQHAIAFHSAFQRIALSFGQWFQHGFILSCSGPQVASTTAGCGILGILRDAQACWDTNCGRTACRLAGCVGRFVFSRNNLHSGHSAECPVAGHSLEIEVQQLTGCLVDLRALVGVGLLLRVPRKPLR